MDGEGPTALTARVLKESPQPFSIQQPLPRTNRSWKSLKAGLRGGLSLGMGPLGFLTPKSKRAALAQS